MAERILENITVNGKPCKVYVEETESERKSIEAGRVLNAEVSEKSAGIGYIGATGKFGNISGQRSQYATSTRQLSPEVMVHLNFLHRTGGNTAVTEFLNKPMQTGSIESAIQDAEEKRKHWRTTAVQAAQEEARWTAVAEQLQGALNLLTGKAPVGSAAEAGRRNGSMSRDWRDVFKQTLNGQTLPRKELRQQIRAIDEGITEGAIYQAMLNGFKRGFLVESEQGIRYVDAA